MLDIRHTGIMTLEISFDRPRHGNKVDFSVTKFYEIFYFGDAEVMRRALLILSTQSILMISVRTDDSASGVLTTSIGDARATPHSPRARAPTAVVAAHAKNAWHSCPAVTEAMILLIITKLPVKIRYLRRATSARRGRTMPRPGRCLIHTPTLTGDAGHGDIPRILLQCDII